MELLDKKILTVTALQAEIKKLTDQRNRLLAVADRQLKGLKVMRDDRDRYRDALLKLQALDQECRCTALMRCPHEIVKVALK